MSTSLDRQITYRPDNSIEKVPYYPSSATTKELLKGYANKNSMSLSKAVDALIKPFFKNMSDKEKDELRYYANEYK